MLLASAQATGGDIQVTNTGELEARSVVAIDGSVFIINAGNVLATSVISNLGNVTINCGLVLSVDKISALLGTVTIVSGRSVIDVDGDAESDIDALNISITVTDGSIGEMFDDLEINTTNSDTSTLRANASKNIFITETAGRLNIIQANSTAGGNIRLATTDTAGLDDNINALAGSLISTVGGWLALLSGDNITLAGTILASDMTIYGDYRNQDPAGSNINISAAITTNYAEINTDVDNDVVVIATVVAIGFVVRVGKGDDEVTGGSRDLQIYGGPGRDILRGGSGNDLLDGGGGVGDELYGGLGNDRIFGSDDGSEFDPNFADSIRFGDYIDGGDGDDQIWGLGGADFIVGGAGLDVIDGGSGSDRILGGDANDTIYTGTGLSDWADGGTGNDTIVGSNVGNDTLFGGLGNDRILGQGCNDTIDAGGGDDYIDAGAGTDTVNGGLDNDEILGGGGVGDTLYGDDGDDVLRGSDDGADFIYGGAGRDRIYGNAGNDTLEGGSGDDTLEGGMGDDLIRGDAGMDMLVGGAGHDVLYGLNESNTGADNAVDYLYEDFGTNDSEVGFGNDRLFGAAGRDLLFGEGGDDLIDDDTTVAGIPPIGTSLDTIDYGSGETANPTDFVVPTPTAPPTLFAVPPEIVYGAASLATGLDEIGRWGQISGSASGLGIAGNPGISMSPSVASSATSQVVAWTDNRNGNLEVYVAEHTANQWRELNGSSGRGGVSKSSTPSTLPKIALVASKPTVTWTEQTGTTSDIRLSQYDAGSNTWSALGNSLSAGGLSGTGTAESSVIADSTFGTVVAWLNTVGGIQQIYVRAFNGTAWASLGASSDSGTGISAASLGSSIRDLTVASRSGRVAIAWTQLETVSGVRRVYLKEYDGTSWQAIAGSASGNGVSGSLSASFQAPVSANSAPSLTYFGNDLMLAWQTYADQSSAIAVVKYTASAGPATVLSVIDVKPRAAVPQLVANGTAMQLLWLNGYANLYAMKWNGTSFVEELPGDATGVGITTSGRIADSLAATIDSAGRPTVVWTEVTNGRPELMARMNSVLITGTVYSVSSTGQSIQQVVDSQVLTAGDVIFVTGTVTGNVTITAADAGVAIIGAASSQIVGNVSITGNGVNLQRVSVTGSVTATNVNSFTLRDSSVAGNIALAGGSLAQILNNKITNGGLLLSANVTSAAIRYNSIQASGIAIDIGSSSNLSIRDNVLTGATGIRLSAIASGEIYDNRVTAVTTALDIANAFTGLIRNNRFGGASVGVRYAVAAQLSDNDIDRNVTGVVSTVVATNEAIGYISGTLPNRIFQNTTGVLLSGTMQSQRVYNNQVGVSGTGTLVSLDLDRANIIEGNVTGVTLTGRIEFQRIARNGTGIVASSNQLISHNLLYGNSVGINVSGKNNTQIIGNTSIDPDVGAALTFSLPAGLNSNNLFNLSGNLLRANASFDFEALSSYILTLRVSDGTLPFDKQLTVSVVNMNDPPTIVAPATQSVAGNTPLVFSTANANALSVADLDAGIAPVQLTLTTTNGLITLPSTAGLTFTAGANGQASFTVRGTLASLNTALNGSSFQPNLNFSGTASISLTINDLGNTGLGGALSATRSIAVTVAIPAFIVDNTDAGYSEVGLWGSSSVTGFNGSSTRLANAANVAATWSAPSLAPGYYSVAIYRLAVSTNSQAANFTVVHNGITEAPISVNLAPITSGFFEVGTFFFSGAPGELVRLSQGATVGNLRTDAVRFTKLP